MVIPTTLPLNVQTIVDRALAFSATQLQHLSVFYPFAAVLEKESFKCVMTDDAHTSTQPKDMIETLQWKLIDISFERPVQTVLAYAVYLPDVSEPQRDAVALEITDDSENSYFYLFTHTLDNGKVVFSGPLVEQEQ